jgi:hypothetical protein
MEREAEKNLDGGVSVKTIVYDHSHSTGRYVCYATTEEGPEQKRFAQLYNTRQRRATINHTGQMECVECLRADLRQPLLAMFLQYY